MRQPAGLDRAFDEVGITATVIAGVGSVSAVERCAEGRLDTQALSGPTLTFEETPDAFEELRNSVRRDVKILTATGQDPPPAIHAVPHLPTPGSV